MTELTETLAQLRRYAERAAASAPSVSAWTVGDHIEHVLIVCGGFAVALVSGRVKRTSHDQTGADEKKNRLQAYSKRRVLDTGRIPRGTVTAPPAGEPKGGLDTGTLQRLMDKTEARLARAATVPETTLAHHPLLGELTRNEVFRFLDVHARHHMAIIDEILG